MELMSSTGFSYSEIQTLSNNRNFILRMPASLITPNIVEKCNQAGLLVEAYGIREGDSETYANMRDWGVEGGTCNSWEGLDLSINNVEIKKELLGNQKNNCYKINGTRATFCSRGLLIEEGKKRIIRN